jgi:hypothetical protein
MKKELISQFKAALKMLQNNIENCPDEIWNDASYTNLYWQIVYHSLHYTRLYLSKSEETFIPWAKHHDNWHQFESVNFNEKRGTASFEYSKLDLLLYVAQTNEDIEKQINDEDLYDLSGFEWLKVTRLELHLYNLRHLQHHTGQLTERLQQDDIKGLTWVDLG